MTDSSTEWPFDQAPNVAAITSTHITRRGLPILQVTHYEDDHSWGFQSGLAVTTEDGQVVAMREILTMDETVVEVADLLPGWSAERQMIGGEWKRTKDEWPDDED